MIHRRISCLVLSFPCGHHVDRSGWTDDSASSDWGWDGGHHVGKKLSRVGLSLKCMPSGARWRSLAQVWAPGQEQQLHPAQGERVRSAHTWPGAGQYARWEPATLEKQSGDSPRSSLVGQTPGGKKVCGASPRSHHGTLKACPWPSLPHPIRSSAADTGKGERGL